MWIYLAILALVALCLLGGIAKCWSIAHRPATNTKCVSALMLLLLAWLLSVVRAGLIELFPMPPAVVFVLWMTSFAIVMAGAVLAVVGLQDYSRRKRFTQGRTQAIWTIALTAALVVLNIVGASGMRWPAPKGDRYQLAGRPLAFVDLNFKFLHPGKQWHEIQTNDLDVKATLAFVSEPPKTHFLIVAGKRPRDDYSLDHLAEDALKSLGNALGTARLTYRGPTRLDRLEGIRLHSQAERAGQNFYYEHRLFETNGFVYQLIAWGRQQDKPMVAADARYLASRFELLNYSHRLHSETNSEFRRRYLQ